jgi:hypothetical protein
MQMDVTALGAIVEIPFTLHLLETAGILFRVATVVTQANAAVLDGLVLTPAGLAHARGIGLDLLVNKGRAGDRSPALRRPLTTAAFQS